MLKTGYHFLTYGKEETEYLCSYCGKHLGSYRREGSYVEDECREWEYCPYCGEPLY